MNFFDIFKNQQDAEQLVQGNELTAAPKLDVARFVEAQIFPTVVLDENDLIVFHNKMMIELINEFGTNDRTDYLAQDISSLVRIPQLFKLLEQVKESKTVAQVNFDYQDNGMRHFWLNISPILLEDGGYNYSFTFRDLTQDIKMERMRTDFIANASHELRTPLASISGFIETLQGPAKDDFENHQKFLSIMQEQTGRMTRLIDDLLSLSKIEMNQHMRPQDIVDLTEIIDHCFKVFEPMAESRNVELAIESELEKVLIKGDRDQLIQLIGNLLNNAFKYGVHENKANKIILRLAKSKNGKRNIISIVDFGNGIAEEDLPRLTERFYRVKHSQKVRGTGLGLAIVKHIAQRHNANVQFKSQLGQGTQAEISFVAV